MRVVIVNHYAYAPDQGAGTRHFELAKFLKNQGYDVLVLSCSFFHKTRKYRPCTLNKKTYQENVDGVDYLWVSSNSYKKNGLRRFANMFLFALRIYKILKKSLRKGDTLVLSSPQPFACLAGYMAAKKNKNYTVYEIRDLWPQAFVDIGGMGKYNPVYVLFKAIEKTLVNNSSLVVSVLSRVEDYFKLEGLSPKNTVWVPNGISKTKLIDSAPCAAKMNSSGVMTIMYAGAHGPAQNLRVVLEAASKLLETQPNIKFQFVGDGSVKQELVEFARENKISNVEFLEPVPKTHIQEMLLSSDLLLLPLADAPVFAYGISPNKLFDYLQSRRPVLYFGPVSASPLVDSDTGIVVKDLSSTGLANAISRFATLSVEEKKQIGQNGYNLLLEKYILEDNFVKIIKCVNESNN